MAEEPNEKWDCSVCTYKNNSEAFKCLVCDTRKGTSTRKPRVTANIVAQQIASSFPTVPGQPAPPKLQKSNQSTKKNLKKNTQPFDFKNIDRESAQDMEVTVNGVTVTITDYQIVSPDSNKNEDQE